MKHFAILLAGLGLVAGAGNWKGLPGEEAREEAQVQAPPLIQLAILLDTSGSMEGLINQARTQVWRIVNELAVAKQDGREPELQVALYEYGKSTLPKEQGYLRQIVAFTDNLDKISEELFALATNGGEEYCGLVIERATKELAWSESDRALKLIFIAGNEPFTQGPVDYKQACKAAVEKGIIVNTIFCGPEAQGVGTGWRDGAVLADGSFMSIDQNQRVAAVSTPYDKKLVELSEKVNTTYLFVGDARVQRENRLRQVAADQAAGAAAPAAAAERAAFKARGQYRAENDLLDGLQAGKLKLEGLKDEELPEALQNKSLEEKRAIVKKLSEERAAIQAEIQKLDEQRKRFLAEQERQQAGNTNENTLDAAILRVVREQAVKKQFRFEEAPSQQK